MLVNQSCRTAAAAAIKSHGVVLCKLFQNIFKGRAVETDDGKKISICSSPHKLVPE